MHDSRHQLFDCDACMFHKVTTQFLSARDAELIRRTDTQLKFKKGEIILKQNAKSAYLVFLHNGVIKFNYENEQGKNFIMTIVSGPKLLGGANLFFRGSNVFSIVAVEDCEVCFVDSRAIKSVLVKQGKLMLLMFEQVVEMFEASIFNFISLAHKQVNGRIADVLIYLENNVYKPIGKPISLSRKEISEFAACSHENVINTLSRLKKEGVLELDGKNIIIKDHKKLQEISKRG